MPGAGREPTPSRICALSMGPFECEHKTPVSPGLREGGGKEADRVATSLGCQRLDRRPLCRCTDWPWRESLGDLGAAGTVPSGGRPGPRAVPATGSCILERGSQTPLPRACGTIRSCFGSCPSGPQLVKVFLEVLGGAHVEQRSGERVTPPILVPRMRRLDSPASAAPSLRLPYPVPHSRGRTGPWQGSWEICGSSRGLCSCPRDHLCPHPGSRKRDSCCLVRTAARGLWQG